MPQKFVRGVAALLLFCFLPSVIYSGELSEDDKKTASTGHLILTTKHRGLGFLGPNGAGKTTTVKLLTGMTRPTSGTATIAGFNVVEQPVEVKKRIGYVPESGALFESLTAWE